jgi:CHAT domain-containing protein
MGRVAPSIILALIAMAGAPVAAAGAEPRDPYAECRVRLAATPDDYEAAFCFYRIIRDGQRWTEAERVFDGLMAAQPENHWLPLAYGHVYLARDPARAERLYRVAAEAFAAAGRADGELQARSSLWDALTPLGRGADAAREVERVVAIGHASSDRLLQARAWSLQALHVQHVGGDVGFAYRLLKQAEGLVFPDGPYRLQRTTLNSLSTAASRAGRLDEAVAALERLDEIAAAARDAPTQAIAQYNLFNTILMREQALPSPDARGRLVPLAQRALATGRAVGNRQVMMRSHSALAELLARAPGRRHEALEHVRACLDLVNGAVQPYDEAVCSWIEAQLTADVDPGRARAMEARAVAATARAGNPRTSAFSAGRQMRLSWSTRTREEAVAVSLAAIDAIETLRASQDDVASSADLFATWTHDYYWLSGRLLLDGREDDVPMAFAITERMRARSLLDALARSSVPPDPRHPAVTAHRSALDDVARVQRALMSPALAGGERRAALAELERLERRVAEARREVSVAFPAAPLASENLATLAAVQSRLAADEALLSFQVGLWETYEGDYGGGAWLIAVTRERARAFRLPDRTRLADSVPLFSGLLESGRGRDAPAAGRLFDDLVAPALEWLPAHVSRLVILPDAALHRLPFGALRAAHADRPLGAGYQIAVAPSASLWLRWRTAPPEGSTASVLVLADPAIDRAGRTAAVRSALLLQGVRLGQLPHAREESRAIARHVGRVDTRLGAQASERMLKGAALQRYDILHVAAHAVADEANPERSAVVLTPGDGREDGLLQAREITALDLRGRIVVLSACYTAAGAVQSGEGVLSLARAFFAAGAHAVIGSRWPLRDADAADLFDDFYQHLGRGLSLAEALQAAQESARAAGRPASAWAALALLGNGDLRPFAGAPPPSPSWAWPLAATVALMMVLGLIVYRRRT